jgi:hypothetical protein
MAYPVAPKTQAAGISAAVSGAALYLLQTYVFKGSVPAGVESLIYASVPGLLAFAAAYWAPHQVRPGDTPPAASGTAAVVLTGEQMEAVREVLAHEQTAAGERKVTPAP